MSAEKLVALALGLWYVTSRKPQNKNLKKLEKNERSKTTGN